MTTGNEAIDSRIDQARTNPGGTTTDYPSGATPTGVTGYIDPTNPDTWPVGLGQIANPSSTKFDGKELPGVGNIQIDKADLERTTTLGEAKQEWYRLTPAEKRAFARELEKLGLVEPGGYTDADLREFWEGVVTDLAYERAATGKNPSPSEYLRLNAKLYGTGQEGAGEPFDPVRKSSSTQTSTSRDVATRLTQKQTARVYLTEEFQRELGRDPSRKEMRAFFSALRRAEKARPTVSEGTQTVSDSSVMRTKGPKAGKQAGDTHTEASSSSNSSSTTREGLDPGAFTQNYVDDQFDAEADARRTATNYYNVLLGMTGAPGGGI